MFFLPGLIRMSNRVYISHCFFFLFKKDFSLLNVFFFSLYYTYVFFFLTAAAAYAWWSWRRLPRARPRLVAAARLDRSIAWTS